MRPQSRNDEIENLTMTALIFDINFLLILAFALVKMLAIGYNKNNENNQESVIRTRQKDNLFALFRILVFGGRQTACILVTENPSKISVFLV